MSLTIDSRDEMHLRMSELQQKLKDSEEERKKLEKTCEVLFKAFREEQRMLYNDLNNKYEKFLEDCNVRRKRNDMILRSLCRVENRAKTIFAKTERLKVLKDRYISYLKQNEFLKVDEPRVRKPDKTREEHGDREEAPPSKSVHWKTPNVADVQEFNPGDDEPVRGTVTQVGRRRAEPENVPPGRRSSYEDEYGYRWGEAIGQSTGDGLYGYPSRVVDTLPPPDDNLLVRDVLEYRRVAEETGRVDDGFRYGPTESDFARRRTSVEDDSTRSRPEVGYQAHSEGHSTSMPQVAYRTPAELYAASKPEVGYPTHSEVHAKARPDIGYRTPTELHAASRPGVGYQTHTEIQAPMRPEVGYRTHAEVHTASTPEAKYKTHTENQAPSRPEVVYTTNTVVPATSRPDVVHKTHAESHDMSKPDVGYQTHSEVHATSRPEVGYRTHTQVHATSGPGVGYQTHSEVRDTSAVAFPAGDKPTQSSVPDFSRRPNEYRQGTARQQETVMTKTTLDGSEKPTDDREKSDLNKVEALRLQGVLDHQASIEKLRGVLEDSRLLPENGSPDTNVKVDTVVTSNEPIVPDKVDISESDKDKESPKAQVVDPSPKVNGLGDESHSLEVDEAVLDAGGTDATPTESSQDNVEVTLPKGLDGVDYQNETYPESYYEQPERSTNYTNIVSNVILEEDEYELDADQQETTDVAAASTERAESPKSSSESDGRIGGEPGISTPQLELGTGTKDDSNGTENGDANGGQQSESNGIEEISDPDQGQDDGGTGNDTDDKSGSGISVLDKIKKLTANQAKSSLVQMLESDSESYQIEHGDVTSANDDSDFDFSFHQNQN